MPEKELITEIRRKIAAGLFEFSKHAVDQTIARHILVEEIKETIDNGRVIENYPEDKHGPSCLIYGNTSRGRPIHVQCSHPARPMIKIITVYEPDPTRWLDFVARSARKGE